MKKKLTPEKSVEQGQTSAPTTETKPEVYHIDPRKDRLALLAIAASLNSTLMMPLSSSEERFVYTRFTEHGAEAVAVKTGYKGLLSMGVEDYFLYTPHESSQFNQKDTLALIERLTETQILRLLHDMGKCPFGHDPEADGKRWRRFVTALSAEEYDRIPNI